MGTALTRQCRLANCHQKHYERGRCAIHYTPYTRPVPVLPPEPPPPVNIPPPVSIQAPPPSPTALLAIPNRPPRKPPLKTGALLATGTLAVVFWPHTQAPEPAAHVEVVPAAPRVEVPYWEKPGWQPITPNPVGDGDKELKEWIEDGGKGYIPDTGGKGIEVPKPAVTTVQVECQSAQTPQSLGLSEDAGRVFETVCALFPEIKVYGGFRAGDQDHGTGNAIDCMVYDDTATGDALAQWLIEHADELPIKYVIWQQRIWQNVDGLRMWVGMEDRGSPTANHYDHVHISVN